MIKLTEILFEEEYLDPIERIQQEIEALEDVLHSFDFVSSEFSRHYAKLPTAVKQFLKLSKNSVNELLEICGSFKAALADKLRWLDALKFSIYAYADDLRNSCYTIDHAVKESNLTLLYGPVRQLKRFETDVAAHVDTITNYVEEIVPVESELVLEESYLDPYETIHQRLEALVDVLEATKFEYGEFDEQHMSQDIKDWFTTVIPNVHEALNKCHEFERYLEKGDIRTRDATHLYIRIRDVEDACVGLQKAIRDERASRLYGPARRLVKLGQDAKDHAFTINDIVNELTLAADEN